MKKHPKFVGERCAGCGVNYYDSMLYFIDPDECPGREVCGVSVPAGDHDMKYAYCNTQEPGHQGKHVFIFQPGEVVMELSW